MEALDQILELVRKLAPPARRQLIERLDELERAEAADGRGGDNPSYSALLALAGTVESESGDLSTDKYKHLADAIAERKL